MDAALNPIDAFLQDSMGWINTLAVIWFVVMIVAFAMKVAWEVFAFGLDEPKPPAAVTPHSKRNVLPAKPVAVPDIYEQMAADDPVILRAERAIARADASLAGVPWPGLITVVNPEPMTCEPAKVELEMCSETPSDSGGTVSE